MKTSLLIRIFVLCISFFTVSFFSSAQDYTGYSNFAGVNGLVSNPANVSDSRFKFHLNLVSANAYIGSNMFRMDNKKFFSFNYSGLQENKDYFKINDGASKHFIGNVDFMGPSLMVNLNKKSAFAISTRVRSMVNAYNLSNSTFNLITDANADFFNKDLSERNVHLNLNSFADASITYGRVLLNEGNHFLKFGVSAKYVVGIGGGSVKINRFDVINLKNSDTITKVNGTFSASYSKKAESLLNGDLTSVFNQLNTTSGKNGWGGDIGLVYEWRKKDASKYFIRLGVAITDITFTALEYNGSAQNGNYTISLANTATADFAQVNKENYTQYLNRLQNKNYINKVSGDSSFSLSLPTALHTNIDWNFHPHFFLNGNFIFNLRNENGTIESTHYISSYLIAPRYESKWFSIAIPFSYNNISEFNWGAGVYVGPLFVGSGSVFSNLFKKDIRNTDFRVALGVPIFRHNTIKN